MPVFEFAIAVCDEADLASGHKRKKEGDIICCKPSPSTWGPRASEMCLIVTLDGLTEEEAHRLCIPLFDDGSEWWPDIESKAKIIGKRRYKISLEIIKNGWLPDMDLAKVRDKKVAYQPLKDAKIKLDTAEKVSIVFDKHEDSFKYSTEKVAL